VNSLRQKLAATPVSNSKVGQVENGVGLEIERKADSFDPYTRVPTEHAPSSKRDLKKLSEWIKMMKALEKRKQQGESDAD
jgi:hypothetical protein